MDASEIKKELAQCTGTEGYHRVSPFRGAPLATDGVVIMAELCKAFWLLDAICSHQSKAQALMGKDGDIKNPQFWKLTVEDNKAKLWLSGGNKGDERLMQNIEYTDFPLKEISVWIEFDYEGQGVMLLPSEH